MRWICLFLFFPQILIAQSVERTAFSCASQGVTTSFGSIQGSVGQVLHTSNEDLGSTVGFEQPLPVLKVNIEKQARNCAEGGLVFLVVTPMVDCLQDFSIQFNGEEVNPASLQLEPGDYVLQFSAAHFCPSEVEIEVNDSDINNLCDLQFYSAVLPNGEPENSQWIIENIDQDRFADNEVIIYNRWADEVWRAKGYNNQDVVFDGRSADGRTLSDATYYYVVLAGGERYQGYIELLR